MRAAPAPPAATPGVAGRSRGSGFEARTRRGPLPGRRLPFGCGEVAGAPGPAHPCQTPPRAGSGAGGLGPSTGVRSFPRPGSGRATSGGNPGLFPVGNRSPRSERIADANRRAVGAVRTARSAPVPREGCAPSRPARLDPARRYPTGRLRGWSAGRTAPYGRPTFGGGRGGKGGSRTRNTSIADPLRSYRARPAARHTPKVASAPARPRAARELVLGAGRAGARSPGAGWAPPRARARPGLLTTPREGGASPGRAEGVRSCDFQLSILAGPCGKRERGGRGRERKKKKKRDPPSPPPSVRGAETERGTQQRAGAERAGSGAQRGARSGAAARLARAASPGPSPAPAQRGGSPGPAGVCVRGAMSYPQGYLYQPSASLALYSCPAYSTSVISGPRTDELGRSSSGSAFSPYAGSTAFTAPSPGYNSHLQYGTDPAAAAAAAFTSYVVRTAPGSDTAQGTAPPPPAPLFVPVRFRGSRGQKAARPPAPARSSRTAQRCRHGPGRAVGAAAAPERPLPFPQQEKKNICF